MRLLKMALEPKDRLVLQAGCQHSWPCWGKPAAVFHDRGKIFTSERARQVLVDRLGIITEQAPPYCPSANDVAAYCTPCAWLACSLIVMSILHRGVLIRRRKQSGPLIIHPIHRKEPRPSPGHDRLPTDPVGRCRFLGAQQTTFT